MTHKKQQGKNNRQKGFTYIESLLYVAIIAIMISALTPFTWSIIEAGSKSSISEEVSSNGRYVSERIKYEIRNSLGINSVTSSQISLCETSGSCTTNPTIITYASPYVTIQNNGATAVNLNSNDTNISSLTFTNNTSSDNKTKNISFVFTIQQAYSGANTNFKYSMTMQSSAEVRSN